MSDSTRAKTISATTKVGAEWVRSPQSFEIVDAQGKPAPRDGTIFNAQYSDGVARVRWSNERQDWETAMSDGRWRSLEYLRGSPPQTWWLVGESFDVDQSTASLLVELQKTFGVSSNSAVIRKALALANLASRQAGSDNTVTISGEGKEPVKVALDD
jgi:hypothetical protein